MGDDIFKVPITLDEALRIHGCSWSLSSDSGLSELDQQFYAMQPPPVSFEEIKDRIRNVYPKTAMPQVHNSGNNEIIRNPKNLKNQKNFYSMSKLDQDQLAFLPATTTCRQPQGKGKNKRKRRQEARQKLSQPSEVSPSQTNGKQKRKKKLNKRGDFAVQNLEEMLSSDVKDKLKKISETNVTTCSFSFTKPPNKPKRKGKTGKIPFIGGKSQENPQSTSNTEIADELTPISSAKSSLSQKLNIPKVSQIIVRPELMKGDSKTRWNSASVPKVCSNIIMVNPAPSSAPAKGNTNNTNQRLTPERKRSSGASFDNMLNKNRLTNSPELRPTSNLDEFDLSLEKADLFRAGSSSSTGRSNFNTARFKSKPDPCCLNAEIPPLNIGDSSALETERLSVNSNRRSEGSLKTSERLSVSTTERNVRFGKSHPSLGLSLDGDKIAGKAEKSVKERPHSHAGETKKPTVQRLNAERPSSDSRCIASKEKFWKSLEESYLNIDKYEIGRENVGLEKYLGTSSGNLTSIVEIPTRDISPTIEDYINVIPEKPYVHGEAMFNEDLPSMFNEEILGINRETMNFNREATNLYREATNFNIDVTNLIRETHCNREKNFNGQMSLNRNMDFTAETIISKENTEVHAETTKINAETPKVHICPQKITDETHGVGTPKTETLHQPNFHTENPFDDPIYQNVEWINMGAERTALTLDVPILLERATGIQEITHVDSLEAGERFHHICGKTTNFHIGNFHFTAEQTNLNNVEIISANLDGGNLNLERINLCAESPNLATEGSTQIVTILPNEVMNNFEVLFYHPSNCNSTSSIQASSDSPTTNRSEHQHICHEDIAGIEPICLFCLDSVGLQKTESIDKRSNIDNRVESVFNLRNPSKDTESSTTTSRFSSTVPEIEENNPKTNWWQSCYMSCNVFTNRLYNWLRCQYFENLI